MHQISDTIIKPNINREKYVCIPKKIRKINTLPLTGKYRQHGQKIKYIILDKAVCLYYIVYIISKETQSPVNLHSKML